MATGMGFMEKLFRKKVKLIFVIGKKVAEDQVQKGIKVENFTVAAATAISTRHYHF